MELSKMFSESVLSGDFLQLWCLDIFLNIFPLPLLLFMIYLNIFEMGYLLKQIFSAESVIQSSQMNHLR